MIRKFSDPELEVCKLCGKGPVARQMSSPAIQFKGSGWYITDYSQKGKSSGEPSATASESKPAADATSSTKPEAPAPAAKQASD